MLTDALFLHQHPAWSPADLMDADQDTVDILDALQHEAAKIAAQEARQARAQQMRDRRRG